MSWVRATGWLLVVLGLASLAGSVAAGEPALGALLFATTSPTGFFLAWLAAGWDKPMQDDAQIHRFGRPADAVVLSASAPRMEPDGTWTAEVAFAVSPRNERRFTARRRVALPGGRAPAAGEAVTVKFDPNRRRDVVLLAERAEVVDHVEQARRVLTGLA
jgi:hypothetical protein